MVFSRTPVPFGAPFLGNPREYSHKLYCQKVESFAYIFIADCVRLSSFVLCRIISCIILCESVDILKFPKKWPKNGWKLTLCRTPLPFGAPYLGNRREYLHKPYRLLSKTRITCLYFYCWCVRLSHPRSLILVRIDSAYATSYLSVIVTELGLILPRFGDISGFRFMLIKWPHPAIPYIPSEFWAVFPLDQRADLGLARTLS